MKALTHMEIRDRVMHANQFNAATYGEWCKAEVERLDGNAEYYEEIRPEIHPKTKEVIGERAWCRIDRREMEE